ncbi:hypothetical protein AVEN_141188-1 [Araneus ventricosus]|uniref:Uncharacterized protein n=1 Tax=Araneus ventricosus TaxID=182803 RepID=A0A4Y2EQJ3_ARAVE|nr:hypothetical protein AVEN_141188-1 [Araneus ventricosus]
MSRSSRCSELCSYTDSGFYQILLALSHVAVSSTLASSILSTRTSCASESSVMKDFLLFRKAQSPPESHPRQEQDIPDHPI